MKVRQRKNIINRWRPVHRRFACSVCYKGVWQRVARSWWSREKNGGVLRFGPDKNMKVDLSLIRRKAKPMNLKGL